MSRTAQLLLAIAKTDRTFAETLVRGSRCWVGKCLHCNTRLVLASDGAPLGPATVEHIVPQHHGGKATNELLNLGIACARCNQQKGSRHDHLPADDPRLRDMIDRLLSRRRQRWREPK